MDKNILTFIIGIAIPIILIILLQIYKIYLLWEMDNITKRQKGIEELEKQGDDC